jgi:site-specific DNA recombinase
VGQLLRVSTDRQADRQLSIPAQRHAVLTYATAHGAVVAREYVEEGFSGQDAQRPAFRRMLEDVLRPGSDVAVIIVHHSSRFTRDATEARIAKSRLRKVGVRVVSVCQDLADDPFGELMEGFFECIDQYESRINGLRTSAAMAECARQGFFPCGRPPYGFRTQIVALGPTVVRHKLVHDPEQVEIVRELYALYVVNGGAKKVARDLNQRGLLYRTGVPWTKDLVLNVLKETAVSGVHWWGRNQDGRLRRTRDWIPIRVEPIVSADLYAMVQNLRAARDPASEPGRAAARPHMLSGLLQCGRCGASFQLETAGNKVEGHVYRYCYYNCRRALRAGDEACPGRRVRAEVLDRLVLERVAEAVCLPQRVPHLRALVRRSGAATEDLEGMWRKMILDEPTVGRAYVMNLVAAIVVHETEAVIVPRRPEVPGSVPQAH